MKFKIEFTPAAARQLKKLPKQAQQRILAVIDILKTNPRPPKAERLKGSLRGLLRVRTGDYRIIYFVENDRMVVCVVRIGDRKEIYRRRY